MVNAVRSFPWCLERSSNIPHLNIHQQRWHYCGESIKYITWMRKQLDINKNLIKCYHTYNISSLLKPTVSNWVRLISLHFMDKRRVSIDSVKFSADEVVLISVSTEIDAENSSSSANQENKCLFIHKYVYYINNSFISHLRHFPYLEILLHVYQHNPRSYQ